MKLLHHPKRGDILMAVFLLLLALLSVLESFRVGVWSGAYPGPGFMPLVSSGLLILFSVLWLAASLGEKGEESAETDDAPGSVHAARWKILVVLPAAVGVLVFLMNYLGTNLMLTVFLLIWFKLVDRFSWKKTVLLSAGIMAVMFVVFTLWLQVPFPKLLGVF